MQIIDEVNDWRNYENQGDNGFTTSFWLETGIVCDMMDVIAISTVKNQIRKRLL